MQLEQPLQAIDMFCPQFLVVGVVKGGTTALYNLLARHPGIYLPPIKETHFFARADMQPAFFSREYRLDVERDIGSYINKGMREVLHSAHVTDPAHYHALFAKATEGQVTGEVCPSYACSPSAAAAIHERRPAAHIFFVLRDPVQRAWSQYLMNLREGKTMERDFLREVQRDAAQPVTGWGVNHQYLALGRYSGQVQRYLGFFPKEQVHILLHEEFRKSPAGVLRQVLDPLGLALPAGLDLGGKFNEAALPRNATLNRMLVRSGVLASVKALVPRKFRSGFKQLLYSGRSLPNLPAGHAEELWKYYADDVDALSAMIGRDLRQWWGPKRDRA